MTTKTEPKGELIVQVCAMPKDVNANGDIFGGWLLSHMDLAGAGFAQKIAHTRVTTVAIDSMCFEAPIHIGEFVSFYTTNQGVGNTSIRVAIEAWSINLITPHAAPNLVSQAVFTYVALNDSGKPTRISSV